MNKQIIVGRLTKDPEVRSLGDKSVTNFSVAVSRRFSTDKTDFFNCQAWNGKGKVVAEHFTKGMPILVEGEMQQSRNDKGTFWTLVASDVQFLPSNGKRGTNTKTSKTVDDFNFEEVPDDIAKGLFQQG